MKCRASALLFDELTALKVLTSAGAVRPNPPEVLFRQESPAGSSSATRRLFEGYTGDGSKDMVDGLMASGDVGRFDEDGRLFLEGREMVVSGGESVSPQEVENCLARHEAVDEEALEAHARVSLARCKVPRDVVFVDELRRNASGKILERELAPQG